MSESTRGRKRAAPSTDTKPLRAAVEAALDRFEQTDLQGWVMLVSYLLGLPKAALAAQLQAMWPDAPAHRIAKIVGVSRTTLYTWPEYMRIKSAVKAIRTLPRGGVEDDGLDAWEA